jgi:hypothetical protein
MAMIYGVLRSCTSRWTAAHCKNLALAQPNSKPRFEYDYLWQVGKWMKTDTRALNCDSDKQLERHKNSQLGQAI